MHHPLPVPAARAAKPVCSRRAGLRALAGGLALAAPGLAQAHGQLWRLGVHPCLPALKLEAMMGPLAVGLGRVLGIAVQVKSRPSFEAFRDELLAGSYDLVLVNPFLFVEATDLVGYVPLARMAEALRAELLAPEALTDGLRALRGRTLALPPRLAAASFLTSAALLDAGLQPGLDVAVRHLPDQVSCLQAVSIGTADACAALSFLSGTLMAIGRVPLHPIWASRPVAGIVIAAHPRVPARARAALRTAMLGWNDSREGEAVLAALGWSGMAVPEPADFDSARAVDAQLHAAGMG